MTPFIFQRGETITVALDAVTGDPADVTAISAKLKALPPGRTMVPEGTVAAAEFSIVSRAASGEIPAGWTLTIAASVSANLDPGNYLADAKLEIAGGIIVTEPIAIRIKPSVTP